MLDAYLRIFGSDAIDNTAPQPRSLQNVLLVDRRQHVAPRARQLERYARDALTVIGLTGETDVVTDGARIATIRNGHPLMARVTAMGCVASALVATCLAVESDAWLATAAALLAIGVAGEGAAARARGPGSFAMEFLDALDRLDRDALLARAKVQ